MKSLLFLFLTVLCLTSITLHSQTTFTGANSNLWFDGGNWTNGAPSWGMHAIIPESQSVEINASFGIDFTITNYGQIVTSWDIILGYNGTIKNFGIFLLSHQVDLQNDGIIINDGVFKLDGTMYNDGFITNNFYFLFGEDGLILNSGVIDNRNIIENTGYGYLVNNPGATIYNCFGTYIGELPLICCDPMEETNCPEPEICDDGIDNDWDMLIDEECGCMELHACNYNSSATTDNGSCEYLSCTGCTYSDAQDYDLTATVDDGSCTWSESLTCQADMNGDNEVNTSDLLSFLSAFGGTCD